MGRIELVIVASSAPDLVAASGETVDQVFPDVAGDSSDENQHLE
jgi:hypothetical protein